MGLERWVSDRSWRRMRWRILAFIPRAPGRKGLSRKQQHQIRCAVENNHPGERSLGQGTDIRRTRAHFGVVALAPWTWADRDKWEVISVTQTRGKGSGNGAVAMRLQRGGWFEKSLGGKMENTRRQEEQEVGGHPGWLVEVWLVETDGTPEAELCGAGDTISSVLEWLSLRWPGTYEQRQQIGSSLA